MAVTRPQTQPGVADAFAADLADAVAYAQRARRTRRRASGAIYGGVAGGMTDEADEFIQLGDGADMHGRRSQSLPPRARARADRRSAALASPR